jgi:excisionase family DNA binding protein
MPSDRLSVKQLAARWGFSERHILRLIQAGELPAVNMSAGSRVRLRIKEEDIQKFDLRRQVAGNNAAPPRRTRRPPGGKQWY